MKNIPDLVRGILSVVTVIFGFTFFFFAAFLYPVQDAQITICVVGLMGTVYGFWLGSSLGSSKKQDTIDAMHKNASADAPDGDPIPGKGPKG